MRLPFSASHRSEDRSEVISVLIADDHPVVRDGIRKELAQHGDVLLVGEAMDGDQALAQSRALQPDVLVLDINMPGMRAVDVVRQLHQGEGGPHVLVLSAYGDLEYVIEMLKAGVAGYLLKDEDPARITEGIRAVARGQTWLSAEVAKKVVEGTIRRAKPSSESQLSRREAQVLRLLGRGLSNEQIAESLTISIGTVKNHVSSLYTKLGVNSRAEAVAWAWQHGLMTDSG